MKKNLISAAVAVATMVGAGTANAVFVNPEGHGQALIYPYYTVEGGHDTYINVVNTTDQAKAVKVRFLEGMNSQEVLDFNLYLSPQDHWSAVVYSDGSGASVRTADTSCTVPNSLAAPAENTTGADVPFRATTYAADSVNGVARTREGYVEIIEMGNLTAAADVTAVTHVDGVPPGCAAISGNFSGKWATDVNADVSAPTGGLYGYGVLINVQEGTNATYDAVALDAFVDPILGAPIHAEPGSVEPGLEQAGTTVHVFDSANPGSVIETTADNGLDAVSAVLMHSSLSNDYVLEPTIAAGTDWVITMPTKRGYVNQAAPADPPFTNVWDPLESQACEEMDITYFDREERGQEADPLDFSPLPPAGAGLQLCAEANVLSFNNSDVLAATSRVGTNLDVIYDNGWASMGFTTSTVGERELATSDATFEGLPAIGFAVQKYVNGALDDGTKSNYAGLIDHRGARSIIES